MMRSVLAVLICLCMLPCAALATEGAYLTGDELKALEPAFEAFLEELAGALVEKGLLQEEEREDWLMYQLGDYLQNGGYGSFVVLYAPGLLGVANEAVNMRRFEIKGDGSTMTLETLNRYVESYSPLPGLPLDVELTDNEGNLIPCRFRWTASGGTLLLWDGAQNELADVGATFINDGRPLYWYEEPFEGLEETLTLEILEADEDVLMVTVILKVVSGADYWSPEVFE